MWRPPGWATAPTRKLIQRASGTLAMVTTTATTMIGRALR
jgi:hypothetical protein